MGNMSIPLFKCLQTGGNEVTLFRFQIWYRLTVISDTKNVSKYFPWKKNRLLNTNSIFVTGPMVATLSSLLYLYFRLGFFSLLVFLL